LRNLAKEFKGKDVVVPTLSRYDDTPTPIPTGVYDAEELITFIADMLEE